MMRCVSARTGSKKRRVRTATLLAVGLGLTVAMGDRALYGQSSVTIEVPLDKLSEDDASYAREHTHGDQSPFRVVDE